MSGNISDILASLDALVVYQMKRMEKAQVLAKYEDQERKPEYAGYEIASRDIIEDCIASANMIRNKGTWNDALHEIRALLRYERDNNNALRFARSEIDKGRSCEYSNIVRQLESLVRFYEMQ